MVFILVLVVVVALIVVAGVHYYLWRRLVRDTTAGAGLPRRVGAIIVAALGLTSVAALIGSRNLPRAVERVLAWPGFLWLTVLLYLVLALVVGEVVRLVLNRVARRSGGARPTPALRSMSEPARPAVDGAGPRPAARPTDQETTALSGSDPAAAATGEAAGAGELTGPGESATPSEPSPAEPEETEARPAPEGSRRLFVSRSIAIAAGAAASATVGYGVATALGPPRVKRLTIALNKLDPRADGFRIALVSDIHLGPILGRAHTQRVVDTINRTRPDLVAIVGDLVDGSVPELGKDAEPLAQLRARGGSYFVTGNHEYYSGASEWVAYVRSLGVHPLQNERVELGGFDLAGVNDISGRDHHQAPDYEKALGDRDASRASILLAHQPVQIHEAVKRKVDLQLSGHTHGGQVWPGNLVARLANPAVAGLSRFADTQLYVTRGVGFWGPPVRVAAPPDITVITLASPYA